MQVYTNIKVTKTNMRVQKNQT